ncbi:MAG TPA: hypothetical protein GX723_05710, partial [Thermoanaerobacterales bacterium]|nr:hypothetical protein [Thermoanaerobacterales bacterium]
MDIECAKDIVNKHQEQSIELLGKAIDCLLTQYGNYKNIASNVKLSAVTISKYHKISKLPHGILWQLQEGNISLGIAEQLARLDSEDDQWCLAFFVVDTGRGSFSVQDCQEVVTAIKKRKQSAKVVLKELTGETFEKIKPLILPVGFEFRFALARASWNHEIEWTDLCFRVINEWLKKQKTIQNVDNVLDDLAQIETTIKNLSFWPVWDSLNERQTKPDQPKSDGGSSEAPE